MADPKAEFLSATHAERIYRLIGQRDLDTCTRPEPNTPIGHTIGYHIRTRDHAITIPDRELYLRFAERPSKKAAAKV